MTPTPSLYSAPSPHEISQLAWTRRNNPDLALAIATEAGRLSDQDKTTAKPVMKEAVR